MDIHIQAGLIALLGMALQVTLKIYSLKQKATNANIQLTVAEYFRQDWLMLLASVLTIGIFLFLVDDIIGLYSRAVNYVKFLFAFVGYTGSDIILRLFSVANKKINSLIDAQTDHRPTKTTLSEAPTKK
jgi:predicted tellurium resistance membrane protein TerC